MDGTDVYFSNAINCIPCFQLHAPIYISIHLTNELQYVGLQNMVTSSSAVTEIFCLTTNFWFGSWELALVAAASVNLVWQSNGKTPSKICDTVYEIWDCIMKCKMEDESWKILYL